MTLIVRDLEFLLTPEGAELLELPLSGDPLSRQKQLRKRCETWQALAVAELGSLRHRAAAGGRFPAEWAGRMLLTDVLLQQASSVRVAIYKGRKLAALAAGEVVDLCSGLGADAVGAALAGVSVVGVDRSEEAVLCAAHNAAVVGVEDRCDVRQGDVTELELPADGVVHVDPDRRPGGRRVVDWKDYSPGEAFLRSLPSRTKAGAIKLSPVMDHDALADWSDVDLEYISEGGVCKQLIAWWPRGSDASATMTATKVLGPLLDPESVSLTCGMAAVTCKNKPGAYLIEPDPAVLAGGGVDDLAAEHGLWRLTYGLDWLFGDEAPDTPLARSFRILDTVPGRRRNIARALTSLGAGVVEVKPRGIRMDTDDMQRALRGKGGRKLTVLWCRLGETQRAFIAEPVG